MTQVIIEAADAREERAPVWARLAPFGYLLACAACVNAVVRDHTSEIGLSGVLVAAGLAPAFALPAIFASRKVRLGASHDGLLVDGEVVRIVDARVERCDRGQGKLHVVTRSGESRSFLVDSFAHAERIVAALPPVSAPSGALAA